MGLRLVVDRSAASALTRTKAPGRDATHQHLAPIEPEWATEAALDPARRFGMDLGSKTGEGIRVVGRSAMAGRVLTVILVPEEHPPAGAWLGVTAWAARGRDLREYELRVTNGQAGDDTVAHSALMRQWVIELLDANEGVSQVSIEPMSLPCAPGRRLTCQGRRRARGEGSCGVKTERVYADVPRRALGKGRQIRPWPRNVY
jgi:hypothetical protein